MPRRRGRTLPAISEKPTAELSPAIIAVRSALEAQARKFLADVPQLLSKCQSSADALPTVDLGGDIPPGLVNVPVKTFAFKDDGTVCDECQMTSCHIDPALLMRNSTKKSKKAASPKAAKKLLELTGDSDPDKPNDEASPPVEVEVIIPDNLTLLRHLKSIKVEAEEFLDRLTSIHQWLGLSVPPFKTTDNTGVDIITHVTGQVEAVISTVKEDVIDLESNYLEQRAEIEVHFVKSPTSGTIRRQMALLDFSAWDDLARGWRGLQFGICHIFRSLSNHWETLLKPREEYCF